MPLTGFVAGRWMDVIVVVVGRVAERRRILHAAEVARLLRVVPISGEAVDAGIARHDAIES